MLISITAIHDFCQGLSPTLSGNLNKALRRILNNEGQEISKYQ